MLEIPDDIVNFFSSRHSSVMLNGVDVDDDVGLLQLDAETRVERRTSSLHTESGNIP